MLATLSISPRVSNQALMMCDIKLMYILLDAPVNGTIEELINESRTAAGVGLVFHHEFARIEANFCIPLRFQTGDLPKRGIQIGLGINFL